MVKIISEVSRIVEEADREVAKEDLDQVVIFMRRIKARRNVVIFRNQI